MLLSPRSFRYLFYWLMGWKPPAKRLVAAWKHLVRSDLQLSWNTPTIHCLSTSLRTLPLLSHRCLCFRKFIWFFSHIITHSFILFYTIFYFILFYFIHAQHTHLFNYTHVYLIKAIILQHLSELLKQRWWVSDTANYLWRKQYVVATSYPSSSTNPGVRKEGQMKSDLLQSSFSKDWDHPSDREEKLITYRGTKVRMGSNVSS